MCGCAFVCECLIAFVFFGVLFVCVCLCARV